MASERQPISLIDVQVVARNPCGVTSWGPKPNDCKAQLNGMPCNGRPESRISGKRYPPGIPQAMAPFHSSPIRASMFPVSRWGFGLVRKFAFDREFH